MNLMRCENGHYYDADSFCECPHCAKLTGEKHDGCIFSGSLRNADTEFYPTYTEKYYNVLKDYESCKNIKEPFIFISYAHADAERVKPYFEILEKNNFRYWYDEGLPSGEDFSENIGRNIKCAVQFIVFLSENAQNSKHVRNELHIADKYDKNILVVYIEDFDLDDGLELTIDRNQNFCAYKYDVQDIEKRFYREISKDALKKYTPDDCDKSVYENKIIENTFSSRYTELKLLTKSRMSEIYSAVNINTGCKVIIKKIIFGDGHNREFFYNCFKNEKRTLEKCNCPFLPQIYDCFEDENSSYIVETYIHGESPDQNGTYSEEFVIDLGIKVAHILKYFYYHGIIHCDIKPNNIIVNELGDVFLIDFGSCIFASDTELDRINTGTQGFAAPEQFGNKSTIDYRTDIYSLGRTMLTLLVGDKISSSNALNGNGQETIIEGVTCALSIPAVKPQYITQSLDYYDNNANLELTRIINKMVSPQKENRYFSIDLLISDLENCRRHKF